MRSVKLGAGDKGIAMSDTVLSKISDKSLFRQSAYIDGAWINANTVIEVDNPATMQVIGTVPNCGSDQTEDAIAAADRAFKTWGKTTAGDPTDRGQDVDFAGRKGLGIYYLTDFIR